MSEEIKNAKNLTEEQLDQVSGGAGDITAEDLKKAAEERVEEKIRPVYKA